MADSWMSTESDGLQSPVDLSFPMPTVSEWLQFPAELSSSTPTESDWLRFLWELSSTTTRTPTEPHWLQIGKKLERNHQLLDPKFDKIFVLTSHDRRHFENCVYLVDISADSNIYMYPIPSLDPVIRFGFLRGHAIFSIVGTKLYMLAGREPDKEETIWSKKMSFYDMSSALTSGETINLDADCSKVLEIGPEMVEGKRCPISVVIGAFKICVFSSILYIKPDDRFDPESLYEGYLPPNFEVYDTSKGIWTRLPEPCEAYDKLDPEISVGVDSYCVHQSSLIIQTNLGIFGINIDIPYPKWVKMHGSESIKKFPLSRMWTMVDKHLCNPFQLVRRGDLEPYPIALRDTTGRESLIEVGQTGVLCLGGVNNCCIVVRGGLYYLDDPKYEDVPNLLVDTVKFDAEDLKNLGSDLCGLMEIQSDKSFNFALNSTPSAFMKVIGCFPLKIMDTSMGLNALKDYEWQKIKDGLQWLDIAD